MRQNNLRARAVTAVGALMYALFAAFGYQAQHRQVVDVPHALLVGAVLFVPAYALLALLFAGSGKRADARALQKTPKVFSAGKAFALLALAYTPMFLIAYPGAFSYDVPFQLRQVFTGEYSTHHPLLHTLLLGGCVALGRLIGNINLGGALYTVLQIAGLCACFALTCASIARSCGAKAARRSLLFFALYPLHMCFAVCATKDILFSGLFALTLALSLEAIRGGRIRFVPLMLCGAGMMLMRNNALYAAVVWAVLLALFLRRRGVRLIAALLAAIVLAMGTNGALTAATGAQEGDICEMLSWPIQQLARARNLHEDRLTQAEKDAIDAIMPRESWRLYDPAISDPVKFEFDTQALLRDPAHYVGVYLSVGAKCPQAYLDAILKLTYSFWYPYSEYGVPGYYIQLGVGDSKIDEWCDFEWLSQVSPLRRVLDALAWRFGARGAMQFPVIGYLFNMGVIMWAMFYFVLREAYLGRWRRFAVCLLPVLLWGTFLLGPVMAGRYAYPFVCVLPVLAAQPKEEGESA